MVKCLFAVLALLLCLTACGKSSTIVSAPPDVTQPKVSGLETVSADLLHGEDAAPVCSVGGWDFYIQGSDSGIVINPGDAYGYENSLNGGRMLAYRTGEATAYLLGSFAGGDLKEGWGSITDLQNGLLCYANGKTAAFYDADTLVPSNLSLDFQAPSVQNWYLPAVCYDTVSETYAAIYQVSNLPQRQR